MLVLWVVVVLWFELDWASADVATANDPATHNAPKVSVLFMPTPFVGLRSEGL